MDEKDPRYEELMERVNLESKFQDITSGFRKPQPFETWFVLENAESHAYLTTLLERIKIEEVELETLFRTPEAEHIYKRAEFQNNLINYNEDITQLDQEVKIALLISQKLKWVAQKELAMELLELLELGRISQIGFSFGDEIIPVL